jgi:hypothetical protein
MAKEKGACLEYPPRMQTPKTKQDKFNPIPSICQRNYLLMVHFLAWLVGSGTGLVLFLSASLIGEVIK